LIFRSIENQERQTQVIAVMWPLDTNSRPVYYSSGVLMNIDLHRFADALLHSSLIAIIGQYEGCTKREVRNEVIDSSVAAYGFNG